MCNEMWVLTQEFYQLFVHIRGPISPCLDLMIYPRMSAPFIRKIFSRSVLGWPIVRCIKERKCDGVPGSILLWHDVLNLISIPLCFLFLFSPLSIIFISIIHQLFYPLSIIFFIRYPSSSLSIIHYQCLPIFLFTRRFLPYAFVVTKEFLLSQSSSIIRALSFIH